MNSAKLFVIEYTLHGAPKSFIIRLDKMDNAEAWHWASCDAGVGRIPRLAVRRCRRPANRWQRNSASRTLLGDRRTKCHKDRECQKQKVEPRCLHFF